MNIQGFQKMTLLDFPGAVACTVFTGGCNLRCPFCHNADLVRTPTMYVNMLPQVMEYLEKRKGLIDGVCVTGGEPLLQPDLQEFLKTVKEMGYRIKLDTNGSLPDKLSRILKTGYIDYVAMDVKSSLENYPVAIGGETDVALFQESMHILQNSGIPYEFRTTVVKGIHTPDDIEAIAKLLKGEERFFLQTFKDSGNLLQGGFEAFSHQEMTAMLSTVKQYVPNAELRG